MKHGLLQTLSVRAIRAQVTDTWLRLQQWAGRYHLWATAALGGLALVATGLAWYWHDRSVSAEREREAALAEHRALLHGRALILSGLADARAGEGDVLAARSLVLAALSGSPHADRTPDVASALYDVVRKDHLRGLLSGHAAPVRQLAFSTDGRRLTSVAEDGSAVLWDPRTGAKVAKLLGPFVGAPTTSARPATVAFLDGRGEALATLEGDGTIRLWGADAGSAFPATLQEEEARAVGICPGGKGLLAISALGIGKGPIDAQSGESIGSMPSSDVLENSRVMIPASAGDARGVWPLVDILHDGDQQFLGSLRLDFSRLILPSAEKGVILRDLCAGADITTIADAGTPVPLRQAPLGSDPIFLTRNETWLSLRSLADGSLLTVIEHVDPSFTSLTFSPDGRWLGGYSRRLGIRVWSMESGLPLVTYEDSAKLGTLQDLRFDPSGRLIAAHVSSKNVPAVHAWWIDEAGELATRIGLENGDWFIGIVNGPEGPRLATQAGGRLNLLDPSGDRASAWEGADPAVPVLTLPSGRIAWAAYDGSASLGPQPAAEPPVLRVTSGSAVTALASDSDGRLIATGHEDGTIGLWTWNPFLRSALARAGSTDGRRPWAIAPGGRWAIGVPDGTWPQLLDLETGAFMGRVPEPMHSAHQTFLAPDGRTALAVQPDGTIFHVRLDASADPRVLALKSASPWVVFSPVDDRAVVTDRRERVLVIDLATGSVVASMNFPDDGARQYDVSDRAAGFESSAVDLKFSPDGHRLLVVHGDEAHVLDTESGDVVTTADVAGYRPRQSGFSRSSDYYTLAGGRAVTLVQASDGTVRQSVSDPTAWPGRNTVPPGGSAFAAVVGDGQSLGIWDLDAGSRTTTLPIAGPDPLIVAFSEDGARLAVIDETQETRIIDAATGQVLVRWTGPELPTAALFSRDGSRLAVADHFGAVWIWRLDEPGVPVVLPSDLPGPIHGLEFDAAGRTLLVRAANCRQWRGFAAFDLDSGYRLLRVASGNGPTSMTECGESLYASVGFAGGDALVVATPSSGSPPILYTLRPGGTFENFLTWAKASSLRGPEAGTVDRRGVAALTDLLEPTSQRRADLMDDVLAGKKSTLAGQAAAAEQGDYVAHLSMARGLELEAAGDQDKRLEAFSHYAMAAGLAAAAGDGAVARYAAMRRGTLARGLPVEDVVRAYRALIPIRPDRSGARTTP